jgi:Na+/melibiose symporter-like transporter
MDFKHMVIYKIVQVFGILGGIVLLFFSLFLFGAIGAWAIIFVLISLVLLSVGTSAKHIIFKDLFPDGRTYHERHTTHTRKTTYWRR